MVILAGAARADAAEPWLLQNFAQRLELQVTNPTGNKINTTVVIPVAEAGQTALQFPGTLAIAVVPGATPAVLPSQADDLDGDGVADEFVFPVRLDPHQTLRVHIYYSTTLRDSLPWPKQVHASHAFGYNHETVALESEAIGYRTYGGFFLDVQARRKGYPGLNNSLVGYFGTSPSTVGLDIIHLGDTLGLGGIFLRSGADVFRPPLNMPDYAHKPSKPEVPHYRVIATGPVRAVVEARMDRWTIGADAVAIQALYSIAAGAAEVECRFRITPLELSRSYEAGAGIRFLPGMQPGNASGRLALSGQQSAQTGRMGLALYYNPGEADRTEPLLTKDDRNECVTFRKALKPGQAVTGRYWVAAAWSGSGIDDVLGYLAAIDPQSAAQVTIGGYRVSRSPQPLSVEGEAH